VPSCVALNSPEGVSVDQYCISVGIHDLFSSTLANFHVTPPLLPDVVFLFSIMRAAARSSLFHYWIQHSAKWPFSMRSLRPFVPADRVEPLTGAPVPWRWVHVRGLLVSPESDPRSADGFL